MNQQTRLKGRCFYRSGMILIIYLLLQMNVLLVSAQTTSVVTLKFDNSSVEQVLDAIESQTSYHFLYNKIDVDVACKVSINVSAANINTVLNQLFNGTGISYKVEGKQIVLSKVKQDPKTKTTSFTVKGVVKDINGQPLIGVNVLIKESGKGTITDIDGRYNIQASHGEVLQFTYIGYLPYEIKIATSSAISVTLREDNKKLDEVVVVGYGTQKKATLTGAISNVGGDKMLKAPVTNVSQGLAGRLSGVVAISNTGEPGYDGSTIRIRGVNTFKDASPLVVVDGVPGRSLDRIDPSTIETVSVLKDASAAIYGAQAANGVILITTKRGKQGKPSLKLSYNQGFAQPTSLPEMCDASEYATLLNEIDKYAGKKERYTPTEIQKYRDGSDPWAYPNTDWYKATLKPWSAQTYGNVSIDGGTDRVKYFVNLSNKFQDGFYRNSGTNYNQYDLRSNIDLKINDYVDLNVNTTGRLEDRKYPTRSAGEIFAMIVRGKPNLPAFWPNGFPGPDIENGNNPVVISTDATGYDRDKRYVFNSDFGVNVKIPGVEGLTFKGNASIDKTFRFRKIWQTPWYLYSWDYKTYDVNNNPVLTKTKKGFDDARLTENMEDNQNILISGMLNYNKTLAGGHKVNLLAGSEKITGQGDYFQAYRRYYQSTAIDQLFAGGQAEINNTGSGSKQARLNYFGRVNYSFKDKYLAEFVWRYQGSYIFEKSSRYAFFPGVSLGYVISEENFWSKTFPVINFAKIRTSWGQTGNDLINPYQYLASYSLNSLMFVTNGGSSYNQALVEGVAPNRGVTWETAIQSNVGLDLQFFKGQLAFTGDYFYNKRKDILCTRNASVPSTAGLSLPDENIGKVQNQGVDFSLDYRRSTKALSYSIGLNGAYAKNKILFWDEAAGTPDYQQSTGRPIGAALYYRAIGVFKDQAAVDAYPHWSGARPGDIIFEDYNKDGKIDGNDRVMFDKSSTPTITGGLNLNVGYKGFDLSVLFQGAAGGIFYEYPESGDFGNFRKSFYDGRWTEDNPNDNHPRTFNRTNEYWVNQLNTYWVHKTDYIRLKTIELGYTLPNTLTKRYLIENLRIYASAFNLLTYSPGMKDFDPENTNSSGYNYPLNKVVNVGLSVTF